jgi:hypothetical protein
MSHCNQSQSLSVMEALGIVGLAFIQTVVMLQPETPPPIGTYEDHECLEKAAPTMPFAMALPTA